MSFRNIMKNMSYSLFGNFISILGSILMITIVPKFMSIEDYGAWQLFLFYFSYVGFLHFGWEDGIYLRYAGRRYADLDARTFSGQIYAIVLLQVLLGIAIYLCASAYVFSSMKVQVIGFISIAMVFANFNTCCNFILQITNRISHYACLIVFEQTVFVSLVMLVILKGFTQYNDLIYCKLFSLAAVTCLAGYAVKELLHPGFYGVIEILHEAKENISVGSKLMLANIANMLILGIIRYGISEGWDITVFGKVSLTLSISNFLMVFINAVSVVLFPILKQVGTDDLAPLYVKLRLGLSTVFLGLLMIYYPLRFILSLWLPQYADSLVYMAILFPVCFFESRVTLLINTYLKSMRQEKLMLKINAYAVVFSLLLAYIGIVLMHDLNLTVLFIVLAFAFRCTLAEYSLTRLLNLHIGRNMIQDLFLVGIFIISSWYIAGLQGMMIYGISYCLYIYIKRNQIISLLRTLRREMRTA